ncbi:unnamed protein product [Prorocentrum cordatum]|uniref:Uncharacterized protein n=1 Tax=Prorocentrum cordatum TaxID=2364126 RepID=A0ABN9UTV2_9DINO|nr:unnamed protein product [Polarella glacialis]
MEDIHRAVNLLSFVRQYLFDDLEGDVLRRLQSDLRLVEQLASLCEGELLDLLSELALQEVLPALLGPWCEAGGRAVARPVAAMLRTGGRLSRAVCSCKEALAFVSTPHFLDAGEEVLGGALASLADAGHLDALAGCKHWGWLRGPADVMRMLDDEALFPLTQLKAVRAELQHARFRDWRLAGALEPFPQLLDHLLGAWFPPGRSPAAPPAELAAWAAHPRFLRRGLLHTQLAVASARHVGAFARAAPLGDPAVAGAVRARLAELVEGAWRERRQWSEAISPLLVDARLLRRLVSAEVLSLRALLRALAAAVVPGALWPLRACESVWGALVAAWRGAKAEAVARLAVRLWRRPRKSARRLLASAVFGARSAGASTARALAVEARGMWTAMLCVRATLVVCLSACRHQAPARPPLENR